MTQIDDIINWLHELIAGVEVIKQRDPGEKQANNQSADSARAPRAAAALAAGSDDETGNSAVLCSLARFALPRSHPSIYPSCQAQTRKVTKDLIPKAQRMLKLRSSRLVPHTLSYMF